MTRTCETGRRVRSAGSAGRTAFTLIELLVVIAMIALVSTVALPSIYYLFSAGTRDQAYNLLSGQLTAARSEAIQRGTYGALHVQLANPSDAADKIAETCFAAVMRYRPENGNFDGLKDYPPRRMPGTVAFGELSATYVSGQNFDGTKLSTDAQLLDFTSFTVVFSSGGAAMRQLPVGNGMVRFDSGDDLFTGTNRLWDPAIANDGTGEPPVTATCLFDYTELKGSASTGARADYLRDFAEFLPVNVHTGRLFPRE